LWELSRLRRLRLIHQGASASRTSRASETVFLEDIHECVIKDDVVVSLRSKLWTALGIDIRNCCVKLRRRASILAFEAIPIAAGLSKSDIDVFIASADGWTTRAFVEVFDAGDAMRRKSLRRPLLALCAAKASQ